MGIAAVQLGRGAGAYERHRPETTTLYAVVRDNVETLYAAVSAGFEGAALPSFVRRELDSYLDCGLLCRGFARLKCESCAEQYLVAFACKGRGFCPSCMGRRMCQTTANLVEHVLPPVPLRQWAFTFPFQLRARLGFDGKLLGAVTRIFVDSVLGWYSRRLRTSPRERAQSGAVVAVQRASSDLKLNPHLHVVLLDGVYAAASDGSLEFRALPRLSTTDVADVLQIARVRTLRYLERRGVIHIDVDADVLHVADDLAERDPALAQLAAAAVSGVAPAGAELRRWPVELVFEGRPGVVITAPLSVREAGFSLHAATHAGAEDEKGREALLKYILRPPLATERLVPRAWTRRPRTHRSEEAIQRRHGRRRHGPAVTVVPPRRARPGAAVPYGSLLGGSGPGFQVEAAHRAEAAAGRARRRRLGSGARLVQSAAPLRHHRLALPPLGRAPQEDVRHRRRNVCALRRPHAPARGHHRNAR